MQQQWRCLKLLYIVHKNQNKTKKGLYVFNKKKVVKTYDQYYSPQHYHKATFDFRYTYTIYSQCFEIKLTKTLLLCCSLFSPCSYKWCFLWRLIWARANLAPDTFGWDKIYSLWFAFSGEKQSRRVETELGIVVESKMSQMLSQSAKAADIWTMIYLPNDSWSDLGEKLQPI